MSFLQILSAIALLLMCPDSFATYKTLPAQASAQCPAHNWFFKDHFCRLGMRSRGAPDCVPCPKDDDTGFLADGIIRGGQPTKEGIDFLKQIGVGLVIDLRTPAEDKGGMERKETAALGLAYLNLSLRMDEPGVEENKKLLSQAIDAMTRFRQSNPHALIYVHCQRGEDRTGLQTAAYRYLVERLPSDAVEHEMSQHYFNWHYPGLADTWRQLKSQ